MQQTARGHDHARLAKATLRHLFCEPGALTGMGHVPRQAFDRDEAATFSLMRRDLTRSNRFAIFKNGARPANADTAAKLRAGESKRIADYPDERRIGIHVEDVARAIHRDGDFAHSGIRLVRNDLRSFSDSIGETELSHYYLLFDLCRIIVPRTRSCRSRCWEKSQAGLANRRLTQTPYKLELSPIRPPLQVRAGLAFFA